MYVCMDGWMYVYRKEYASMPLQGPATQVSLAPPYLPTYIHTYIHTYIPDGPDQDHGHGKGAPVCYVGRDSSPTYLHTYIIADLALLWHYR